jgi:hypothetical protein
MRIALAVLILACGGRPIDVQAELVPPSDRDPLPYTPPASSTGHTDETVALAATGGEDQARQMLPALLRAVRDADELALERLLSDEVVSVQGRGDTRPLPRSVYIERVTAVSRRAAIPPDVEVGQLVDLTSVRVTRAGQFWAGRQMPEGVRATDLVVEAPLLDEGRASLRAMLLWTLRAYLAVRVGRDPRIVAL